MAAEKLCPIDRTPLTASTRQDVEIDQCPACRGVWLDRGELDKIVERSAALAGAFRSRLRRRADQGNPVGGYSHQQGSYARRGKSFLEDLFG